MPTGSVNWFNGEKDFGFIQPKDGWNDVFVHISAAKRTGLSGLAEGQKVSFDIKTDKMRVGCARKYVACLSPERRFTDVLKWRLLPAQSRD